MMFKLNTLIIGKAGEGMPATLTVTEMSGKGLSISGLPEGYSKAMLLKALTAISSSGFRAENLPFHISVSDYGTNPSALTLAVAVSLLIASGQTTPTVNMEDVILYGDLRLNGNTVQAYTPGKNGIPTEWPRKDTQFLTDHNMMHIVPEGTNHELKMTCMGPLTVEAYDLRHIHQILKNKKEEV